MVNDLQRWRDTARCRPSWVERNRLIATLIEPGASVIDAGCGSMSLRDFLRAPRSYVAVDVVRVHPGTLYADFNARVAPGIAERHDYVVCSGLLEYIVDPGFLLRTAAGWGRRIIMSYASREHLADRAVRVSRGWLNHYTKPELLGLFREHDLAVRRETVWPSDGGDQDIFVLDTDPNDLAVRVPGPGAGHSAAP